MLNTYKIILNKNGKELEIKAGIYFIKDNIINFEVYNEIFTTVACFNLNNIIGFYKARQ